MTRRAKWRNIIFVVPFKQMRINNLQHAKLYFLHSDYSV